jgi:uncharacterized protein (DUF4415 family)
VRFEWDEYKDRLNRAKHGVSFETARLVFDDPLHLSVQDRIEGGEARWQTLVLPVMPSSYSSPTPTARRDQGRKLSESSQRARPRGTRDVDMNRVSEKQAEELRRLAQQDEEAVDTNDIPEITNWDNADRGRFYRPMKEQVTLRIDADVLAWFRAGGNKYQTRINAALREYIRQRPDR